MSASKRKRITMKPKCPNPLFEHWLTEWRDKARESDSKMQYCFVAALKSLRKYPLPLETGKDCKILSGFGEKLCKMLDDKLAQHKDETVNIPNVIPEPKTRAVKKKESSPKKVQSTDYIPQYGSGAFAILVTLYEKSLEPQYPGFLTKSEIITQGQHLSNASFTKPGTNTRYTAWSSMKTLLEKNLVTKQGNPAKFNITVEGATLGEKLYIQQKIEEFQKQENEDAPSCSTAPTQTNAISRHASTSSSTSQESVIRTSNSFDIILLVDTQELNGSKDNSENDPIIRELQKLNVHHEIRNLNLGDYVWICRDSVLGTELVLPYIIERKRMDDLGKSIKDDRFHEQKFRLKQCGLQNLIYVVENHGKNEHVGLPITTLMQAATNTLVQDGFSVKFTDNLQETCRYLACLTNFISRLFQSKTIIGCHNKEAVKEVDLNDDVISLMDFKEFNKSSSKIRHFKVKDMFVRHLLQIKGMSVDKALAITAKYATPKLLKLAYGDSDKVQGEKLLSNIQYGTLKKNVGPVLSRIVYQFFCDKSY